MPPPHHSSPSESSTTVPTQPNLSSEASQTELQRKRRRITEQSESGTDSENVDSSDAENTNDSAETKALSV